jgi:hypothetical protein
MSPFRGIKRTITILIFGSKLKISKNPEFSIF